MEGKSYILVDEGMDLAVGHAIERLACYAGIQISEELQRDRQCLRATLTVEEVKNLGTQGFSIKSSEDGRGITIAANAPEGVANGVYEMLRTLMIKSTKDPFGTEWNLKAKPAFGVRGMVLGCYNFGLAEITPDMWTFENWKEYLDFLRLMNVNLIVCLMAYAYHKEVPQTERHKWRYETLRKAMKYAQERGIKFHLAFLHNFAPQALWWKHPELRAVGTPGYYGVSFCWHRAKSVILNIHREMMEFFKGLDGYELMYLEGCGVCLCPECSKDIAGTIVESYTEIRKLLKETNPDAECVFWNWLAEALPSIVPSPMINKLQDNLLKQMPKGVLFVDASGNFWRKWLKTIGKSHEGVREQLNLIHKSGYRALDLLFFMDVEGGLEDNCSVFPHPFIKETIDEIRYGGDNLNLEGVLGYRLAPPTRFLGDFFFLRLAFNPDLTTEQLLEEAASFLTTNPENEEAIKKAISLLEEFWNTMNLKALEEAEELFARASQNELSRTIKNIADGVSILLLLCKLAKEKESPEDRVERYLEIYQRMKPMPIYQGYTSEHVWESRATKAWLFPRISWWVDYLRALEERIRKSQSHRKV